MANLNIAIKIAAEDKASGPIGRIKNALGGLSGSATKGFSGLQSVAKVAGGALVGAVGLAGAAMAGVGAKSVSMAMDMESQMSGIAAVLGTTKEQIAPLGGLIRDLGLDPTLKVNATEAAAAIEMLARNGLNMDQILEGAAHSTVLLANATGSSFDNAANIATDAMSIFNIEAANMTDAVDGIVSVTTNSKFTIDDFSLALAQGGGVASAIGVDFADFNTTIAAIAPLFKSGSDAGTSLKTMLTRLVPASGPAAGAMMELGIITEEGANRFFDAEGNMRSMAEVAGVLAETTGNLSDEQKASALSTIFGTDAMRAAVALADTGEEAFRGLAEQMGNTDAQASAAERMNNLAGVMEILQGIGEGLMLTLGNGLLPVFRLFADSALVLAEEALPKIESALGIVSEIVSQFTANLEEGMGPVDAFTEAIWDFAPPGLLTFLANLRKNIKELSAWFASNVQPIINMITQFVSWKDALVALGVVVASIVLPALAGIIAAVAPVIAVGAALIGAIALVRNAWENDWGGIRTSILAAWEGSIKPALETLWVWLNENIPVAIAWLKDRFNEYWPIISGAVGSAWEIIRSIFSAITSWLSDKIPTASNDLKNSWQAAWGGIQAVIETAKIWIADIGGLIAEFVERAKPILTEFAEKWSVMIGPAIELVKDAVSRIMVALGEMFALIFDGGEDIDGMEQALRTLEIVLNAVITAVQLVAIVMQGIAWAVEQVNEAIQISVGLWDQLGTIVGQVGDRIPDWLKPGSPPPLYHALTDISRALDGMPDMSAAFGFNGGQLARSPVSAFSTPALAGAGAAPTPAPPQFTINVYANDEAGGRRAGRAVVGELRSRGIL